MSQFPLQVQIQRLDQSLPLPRQANEGDAGLDLFAAADVRLFPGERALIATGIALAIPAGFAGYVQPRSGLAKNKGLGLLNSPGLIDSGYRGEVSVIAINLDPVNPIEIKRGERIAQLVILAIPSITVVEVEDLSSSKRGTGGFGSSGV